MRFARIACLTMSLALLGCNPTANDIYEALPSIGSALPAFHYVALAANTLIGTFFAQHQSMLPLSLWQRVNRFVLQKTARTNCCR